MGPLSWMPDFGRLVRNILLCGTRPTFNRGSGTFRRDKRPGVVFQQCFEVDERRNEAQCGDQETRVAEESLRPETCAHREAKARVSQYEGKIKQQRAPVDEQPQDLKDINNRFRHSSLSSSPPIGSPVAFSRDSYQQYPRGNEQSFSTTNSSYVGPYAVEYNLNPVIYPRPQLAETSSAVTTTHESTLGVLQEDEDVPTPTHVLGETQVWRDPCTEFNLLASRADGRVPVTQSPDLSILRTHTPPYRSSSPGSSVSDMPWAPSSHHENKSETPPTSNCGQDSNAGGDQGPCSLDPAPTVSKDKTLTDGNATFVCRECNVTFEKRFQWSRHKSRKHERRFQCPDCTQPPFGLKADLMRHMKARHHENVAKASMACSSCEKSFTRLDNLRRHIRSAHGTEKSSQPAQDGAEDQEAKGES